MSGDEKTEKKRCNSFGRGIIGVLLAAIFYIAVPELVMIYAYPYLEGHVALDGLTELFRRWEFAGIPLIILSFPRKFYGVGKKGWLVSSVIFHLVKIFWILYVINFGDLSGLVSVESSDRWMSIDIVLSGFMYLMVALRLLKLLVVYGDYRDNRDEEPPNDREKPANPATGDGIRVKGRFS